MIKYIKLKNYKSFTDLSVNFCNKKKPLPLVIIYGENGSGKTNLINIFDTLTDTFRSMQLKNLILSILENADESLDSNKVSALNSLTDISKIIARAKTIGSTENMIIDIGFSLDGNDGAYYLEFNNESIVKESLEFQIEKNKGVHFCIDTENTKLNPKIFNGNYSDELAKLILKFWGKHSLMSILFYEKDECTNDFLTSNIHNNLFRVLDFFESISTYMVDSNSKWGVLGTSNLFIRDFEEGEIDSADIDKLMNSERIVRQYLTNIYRDIVDVHYDIKQNGEKTTYNLILSKMIGNSIRDIDISLESTGTRNLMLLLPYFLISSMDSPGVVLIDEIDNGIHDILLQNLMNSINKSHKRQLIITTHNLMLLSNKDFRDYFYFIDMDENGNKEVKSIYDFDRRIQSEHNLYLGYTKNNWFKGLPWEEINLNFEELESILHNQ